MPKVLDIFQTAYYFSLNVYG